MARSFLDTSSITQSAVPTDKSMVGRMVLFLIIPGSVYSDALTYKKHLVINNDGHLEWALPRTNAYNELKITSRMGLKRMDPYNQGDHDIILEMLDRAFQSISPANF